MTECTEQRVATALRAWRLCQSCARCIFGHRQPTPDYAEATARLLFMTAAHESDGFRARRQYGFDKRSEAGAFGLWQSEWCSIHDSLCWLQRHADVLCRTRAWLTPKMAAFVELHPRRKREVLRVLQVVDGDPLACLLARLHYFHVPTAIPLDTGEASRYAKVYYNTFAGKATPDDYRRAFEEWWPHVQPNERVKRC